MLGRGSDDVVVRIEESHVMGRTPVMVLSAFVMIAGVSQFVGGLGSKVLNDLGGYDVDLAWSVAAILSFILVWTARYWKNPQDAAVIEIGGIVLIDCVFLTYAAAVLSQPGGFEGRVFVAGACASIALNCAGRAFLLWKRHRWVGRVSSNG